MSCRRFSLLLLAAVLLVVALPAASAAAAAPKVLLVTRGEGGEGPPAASGEAAEITNFLTWAGETEGCGGTDEGAVLGKNPAPTAKVAGSNLALGDVGCFGSGETGASIQIKSISLTKSGTLTLLGHFEVRTACHYRATKFTGSYTFGPGNEVFEEFLDVVSADAKLVKKGSAAGCAATTTVEDEVAVANREGYNYLARLTG